VAQAYGHVNHNGDDLERQLQEAIEQKDWQEVARLSNELTVRNRPPTG
jgi:hypothetical protein